MFRWESPARTRAYVWEVTLLLSDILIVFVSDDDDDDDDEDDDDDDNNKRIFQDAQLTRYCLKDVGNAWDEETKAINCTRTSLRAFDLQATYGAI